MAGCSFDCPECSPDSKAFRLGYNLSHNYSNCYLCGRVEIGRLLHSVFGLPWKQCRELKHALRPVFPDDGYSRRGTLQLPEGLGPLRKPQRLYLASRQLAPDQCVQLWGLQACPIFGPYKHRIFIPIHLHGRVVSWVCRSLDPNAPKRYLAAKPEQEVVSGKEVVFGLDYVRHAAIICEGPFDVFKIGPGAVCTLGTAFSRAQLRALATVPRRIVCYDSSPDAQIVARRLCSLLAPFDGETLNVTLDAKDPGEASDAELVELRKYLE